MYYNYGDGELVRFSSKMPLLDGGDRNKGVGIIEGNIKHNIIILNIQAQNYSVLFYNNGSDNIIIFDNCLGKTTSNSGFMIVGDQKGTGF